MFERIALGFDGSTHSRRASRFAVALAEKFRSQLTILVGRSGDTNPELDDLVPVTESGKSRAVLLEEIRAAATTVGARSVQVISLDEDVLDSMVAWLEAHPQDLMIVGSRGQSRGRRLLMGSVSSGLVARAPCPVLVVRGAVRLPSVGHPGLESVSTPAAR
jgi:nucleotide-binding universal stress UspA family protein